MATAACPGGPVAGDAAAFAATVQERYAGLRPFYSNLLDDLGATDTFVIDGDALMLELLGGERMDWRSGGQFLALRAELERFVAGINAANTAHLKWWTVFFNSNSALLPGAAAQAARALAQAWLPGALGVQTLRFDSWWCADWLAWVEATRPAMLLLTDLPLGSEGRSSIAGAGIAGPGDSSDSGAACLQERRLFLQAYVVHAQGEAGLQCAFISELRFLAEGLIFGFRTGWTSAAAAGRRRDTTPAEAAAAVGQAFLDCPTAAAAAAAAGQALAAQVLDLNALPLQIASQAPPGGVRAALGATCCGMAATLAPPSMPPDVRQLFAQAWCLHELLMRQLRLQDRALRLPEQPAAEEVGASGRTWPEVLHGLNGLLSSYHSAAAALLSGGAPDQGSSSNVANLAQDASMADWLDGRLFYAIALALWQGQPVGPLAAEEQAQLQELAELVQQAGRAASAAAGHTSGAEWTVQLPQDGAKDPAAPGLVSNQPPPQLAAAQPPVKRLLPVQGNALMDAVVGSSGGGADDALPVHDSASAKVPAVVNVPAAPYHANFHWRTGQPLDASQLEVGAADDVDVVEDLAAMNLEEMAASATLPRFVRRSATNALQQIDMLLKGGFKRDAQSKEQDAKAFIIKKAKAGSRAWQTYYRHLEKYAKSLDASKFSHPTRSSSSSRAKGKPQQERASSSGSDAQRGGGQKQVAKKADLIKAKNAEQQAAKRGGSAEEQWATLKARLQATYDKAGWTAEVSAGAAALLDSLAAKSAAVYLVAATWRLEKLGAAWETAMRPPRAGSAASGIGGTDAQGELAAAGVPVAVELWAAVSDLLQRGLLLPGSGSGVPEEVRLVAVSSCHKALRALGLAASVQHLAPLLETTADGGLGGRSRTKESKKASGSAGGTNVAAGVGLSDCRFQLRHCGHLLPHEAPPQRDPRVESFNPDPWQRKVLDAVDSGSSALIVAPTSSGKTFISSYCISAVVRRQDDPDGVVVFVAPTKALVNQVAAQVYKDFEASAGVGVFTRDYRHNVEGCRILVTVPACLEILLLSPTAQSWVRRIRYAILDEVHCMREVHLGEGGARDGAGSTWEHILLLLRCPFLALSATIGNPHDFRDWLGGVKRLQAEQDAAAGRRPSWAGPCHHDVALIQHTIRHSDLRLHTYRPRCLDDEEAPGGPWGLPISERVASLERQMGSRAGGKQCGSLVRMNPLAVLEPEDLQQGAFPPELALEPADVEQLYDGLRSAVEVASTADADGGSSGSDWRAKAAAQLAELAPEPYFAALGSSSGRGPFHTRHQVRQYEAALKAVLLGWASGNEPEGRAAAAATLAAVRQQFQTPPEHDSLLEDGRAMCGLVLDLLRRGLLPAIAFSFERRVCHRLAEQMVQWLEECEAQEREVNADKYRALRRDAERAAKAARAARDRKPDKCQAGGAEDEDVAGAGWDDSTVLPEFSLAGKPKRLSADEVEQLILETAHAGGLDSQGDPLVRGLRRGIGIHHGGLPKVYRQVVEILFRAGHLRVVIATGTLAFGIHMPCRTVAFVGDHLFLSSLQFRQMMGRAGRRGFDPLGHVVFFGVGARKVRSLMISPVPQLLGHFPLTITMCLRALALHHIIDTGSPSGGSGLVGRRGGSTAAGGAGGPVAVVRDTLSTMFKQPFFAEGRPALLQQVQHLFSFATAYLAETGAIGLHGEPVGLAGMLCHLHWTDPCNLALASLLRSGALDKICRGATEGMPPAAFEPIAEQLLTVCGHLFQRLPLHRATTSQPERFRNSPSKVVLEEMPPAVADAVERHNREALALFVDYMRSYVAGLEGGGGGEDDQLPLSGVRLPAGPEAVLAVVSSGSPASAPAGSLRALLASLRVGYTVCSPFAALSGRGDEFASMDELVRSVRSGILLDVSTLPTVGMTDRHGQPVPLNRYALDYFKHGQKVALVEANGLREGDAWQALSTFSDVLRVTAAALGQLLPEGTFHPVVYCMERLAGEFKTKFELFNAAPGKRGGY